MNLSTRLLAALLPTVAVIMLGYSALAIRQRKAMLVPAAQRETVAYATALGLALESHGLASERLQDVINEAGREPKIYGILVYDSAGRPLVVSDPLRTPATAPRELLQRVLEGGETVRFERDIDEDRVYSVLRPLHSRPGAVTGVLEVAQSMALLTTEQNASTRRSVQNTLTLFAALILVTVWLVRRFVGRPLERFLDAVRALERGELTYRVDEGTGGGELVKLGREFNRMAEQLQGARSQMIREAEERLTLERRLRESEKLAAVGNLAAGLAHEIGAPLNVIAGRAEMLLEEERSAAHQRNVQIIIDQIERITTTVHSLLGFARRREPKLQAFDLNGTIADVVEFMERELSRRGILLERQGTGRAVIQGDPDLLHHVFVNLLLNAMHAIEGSDGERRIVVRVLPQDVSREPDPDGERPADGPSGVIVDVMDSGPGINPDELARIFEPFYSTKESGTGLGLVIARSIVEQQGGVLYAYNRTDSTGAIFRCVLPAGSPAHA
ncbi:MAG: HAMP domain-containing protein [Gemmatimonadetes bacterium]|nr:HAMP domain-containing protein [Gemmatimonadota bacterium]